MKRKLFAFSMTLALLLSMLSVAGVGAHSISIENSASLVPSRTDWFGLKPSAGYSMVQRNNAQQGEVVFGDAVKTGGVPDARQIAGTNGITLTRATNLDYFSVTADADRIYFLAKVDRYVGITQSPSINLVITIDGDHANNSGSLAVPVGTGSFTQTVNVPAEAAWEKAINLQFKPGNNTSNGVVAANKILVYTNPSTSSNCGSGCAAQLASAAVAKGSFVELSIPWGKAGDPLFSLRPAADSANFLRFTVSTTLNNLQLPSDGFSSPVIDVLSNTGKTTFDEIKDGALDTSFDVHFDTNAPQGGGTASYEPYAPLLITEFQANPIGKDTPGSASSGDAEWIEIYNPNNFSVQLSDYKLGNAATRNTSTTSSQGMYKFKSLNLASKGVVVVTTSKSDFAKAHPSYQGTLLQFGTDLTKYAAWAGGTISLDNIGTAQVEDQVVLLDAKDDIVDLVNYGNPVTPTIGNVPIRVPDVPESTSYERCPAGLDTNGGFIDGVNDPATNTDFVTHDGISAQTPGVACQGRPGLDNSIAKSGPTTATVGTDVPFTITYSNIGTETELSGVKATIVDTLPAGMTFQSAALPDGTPLTPVVNGQTVTFSVDAPGKLSNGFGPYTIVLTGTISPSAPQNTALINRVTISSPNELADTTTQANNQAEWTVTTLGPAVLTTSITPVLFAAPPGRAFSLTLNYANTGQSVADGVQVELAVPAGVQITSVNSGGATPTFPLPVNGPTTLKWNVDQLDAVQNGAISVAGKVLSTTPEGTEMTFTSTVSSTTGGVANATFSAKLKAEFIKLFIPIARFVAP